MKSEGGSEDGDLESPRKPMERKAAGWSHLLGKGLENGQVLRVWQHGLLLLDELVGVAVENIVVVMLLVGGSGAFLDLAVVGPFGTHVFCQVVVAGGGTVLAAPRRPALRCAGQRAQIPCAVDGVQRRFIFWILNALIAILLGLPLGNRAGSTERGWQMGEGQKEVESWTLENVWQPT